MADIKVERRSQNTWLPWVALAIALVIALIVANALRMQAPAGGGGGGPVMAYHGHSWQPFQNNFTQPVPDQTMRVVGTSQGQTLYTNKAAVMGGGGGGRQGGMALPNTPAYGRIYLKKSANSYEPLQQMH
jgi:hypothetical protein